MIARARRQPEPTTLKELALWLAEEKRQLGRRLQRMPKKTNRQAEARLLAAIIGTRQIQNEADRLDKKITKGDDND